MKVEVEGVARRPRAMQSILTRLTRLEYLAACAVLLAIPFFSAYATIELPGLGAAGAAVAIGVGAIVAWTLALRSWTLLRAESSVIFDSLTPGRIIVAGLVLQVLVAWLTAPSPQSDGASYLGLADRLAGGQSYQDSEGRFAFWPVGLPLYLAPFVRIFGAGLLAVTLANAVLYVVGLTSIWRLGREIGDRRSAAIASVIFTLWPSRLLLAGVVAKELLCIALLAASLALFFASTSRRSSTRVVLQAASGAAAGWAALAQPGLLLLVLLYPVIFRQRLSSIGIRASCIAIVLVAAGLAALVTPWIARNCSLFNGQFCGIATNGGSVFYRANNPIATGEWIAEGAIPITHLPELEQNKVGFELGKAWIRDNPVAMAKLSVRKIGHFLGGDSLGAYMSVKRGSDSAASNAGNATGTGRLLTYRFLNSLSLMFWVVLACLALRGWRQIEARGERALSSALPLVYPILYGVAVFSVFESGDRQHMFAVPGVIVLASIFLSGARHSDLALEVPSS